MNASFTTRAIFLCFVAVLTTAAVLPNTADQNNNPSLVQPQPQQQQQQPQQQQQQTAPQAALIAATTTTTATTTTETTTKSGQCQVVRGVIGSNANTDHHDVKTPGRIDLSNLGYSFADPVVFVSPPTLHSPNAAVVRLQQTLFPEPRGFKLWIAETEKGNGWHLEEQVGWVVFENGDTKPVGDNCNFYVGSTTVTNGFTNLELPWASDSYLGRRPWIFQMIQSTDNGANPNIDVNHLPNNLRGFVKTRMTMGDNDWRNFKWKLETDELESAKPVSELVGYLAINSGCKDTQKLGDLSDFAALCPDIQYGQMKIAGVIYDYALGIVKTGDSNMATQLVSYGKEFKNPPIVLANIQTYLDGTPVEIRTKSVSTKEYRFVLEEDNTKDTDTQHKSEWVAWLALGTFA